MLFLSKLLHILLLASIAILQKLDLYKKKLLNCLNKLNLKGNNIMNNTMIYCSHNIGLVEVYK